MEYEWAVIGAGPAGIAAIGKLIDFKVDPKQILWIDPKFTVGDFGTLWRNIPSNTKVKLFLKFLYASAAFNYKQCPHDFKINYAPEEETCHLRMMADPLEWVTQHLLDTVKSVKDTVEVLSLTKRTWHMQFKLHAPVCAKNVILAIGAEPKNLSFSSLQSLSLSDAMDKDRLRAQITPQDSVAVFGSSHSAILALRNLVELNVKHIINFYRSPLRYAVYLDNWILFDDSGLKGPTAQWARENLDGVLPSNLSRVYSNNENLEHYLPQCDKAVYAIGFERRLLPIIKNVGHVSYMEQCGIISPGLFGLGIAFPQAKVNKIGILEYRVGLWKFIEYLHEILPIWFKYPA